MKVTGVCMLFNGFQKIYFSTIGPPRLRRQKRSRPRSRWFMFNLLFNNPSPPSPSVPVINFFISPLYILQSSKLLMQFIMVNTKHKYLYMYLSKTQIFIYLCIQRDSNPNIVSKKRFSWIFWINELNYSYTIFYFFYFVIITKMDIVGK